MLVNPIAQNLNQIDLWTLSCYFSFALTYPTIFVFDRYDILHLVLYTVIGFHDIIEKNLWKKLIKLASFITRMIYIWPPSWPTRLEKLGKTLPMTRALCMIFGVKSYPWIFTPNYGVHIFPYFEVKYFLGEDFDGILVLTSEKSFTQQWDFLYTFHGKVHDGPSMPIYENTHAKIFKF